MSQLIQELKSFVEPLKRRILLMLGRAVVKAIYDDSGIQLMKLDLMADETRDKVERFQDYGFSAHPPKGSEAVVAFVGGNRAHGLVLKVDNREYRLKNMAEGEVALYSDEGDYIWFKRNNELHIHTAKLRVVASTDVEIDTPLATFTGNVKVEGDLEVDGDADVHQNVTVDQNLIVTLLSNLNGAVTVGGAGMSSTGDIATSGEVSDGNGSMSEIRSIYNTHTHPQSGGGTTSAPNESM